MSLGKGLRKEPLRTGFDLHVQLIATRYQEKELRARIKARRGSNSSLQLFGGKLSRGETRPKRG